MTQSEGAGLSPGGAGGEDRESRLGPAVDGESPSHESYLDAELAEGPPPGSGPEWILVTLIGLFMMVLPVAQIIGRLTRHDITGAGPYTQHGTVWIAFLGAVLATGGGRHLGLSTSNFMQRGRLRTTVEWLCTVVFVVVTLVLAYASARMVSVVRGTRAPLPGGIPEWWSEMVMPVCFALMAARALFRATEARDAHGRHLVSTSAWSFRSPPGHRVSRLGWALRGLGLVLAGFALYLGMKYDSAPRLAALVDQLDHARTLIKWVGLITIGVSFLLGAPVFVAMAGVGMVLFFASGDPVASMPTETFRMVENPALPAIPLLTIAGYILAAGNSSQRLVRAYKSVFGWMPGGLAVMAVFVCALFTTFTGASGVTILALGGLVYPMLLEEKYPQGFSLGLVTAAGSLGLLFPPSLPVLLYSVAASAPGSPAPVDMRHLFIGGLIPGTLMVVLVCLYGVYRGVKAGAPRQTFNGREVARALWAAKWDLVLPILVIGAFASGLATVVEAAALGSAYALLVELFVYRDVHPLKELPGVFANAASLVGAVVVLLGVALGLTNWLVTAEVPTHLVEWVQATIHSRWLFLLALNVILLVLGSVLEIYSAIVVLVPLVAPLGVAFGIDPVHLGVIFLSNLELGFLFPPMGLNLFLAASRFRKPLPTLYKEALPFLLIMAIGVLFITYCEPATTLLIKLIAHHP